MVGQPDALGRCHVLISYCSRGNRSCCQNADCRSDELVAKANDVFIHRAVKPRPSGRGYKAPYPQSECADGGIHSII